MIDGEVVGAGWQPVAAANADRTRPHRVDVAGRPYALVHLAGDWVLVSDRCPHRFAPLSAGMIVGEPGEERLQCAYHGWQFDGDGRCRLVPSLGPGATAPPRAATAEAGAVVERDGRLWACFEAFAG